VRLSPFPGLPLQSLTRRHVNNLHLL
jgi:hypothetical protein